MAIHSNNFWLSVIAGLLEGTVQVQQQPAIEHLDEGATEGDMTAKINEILTTMENAQITETP